MQSVNIAVFASGSGSNFENLARYFSDNEHGRVVLLVCNKPDAPVLERARNLGIDFAVVTKAELQDPERVMPLLRRHEIGFVVLAGFLPLIPDYMIEAFPQRMVNIHPSLLPKYGGKGMWGHHVHEAVKAAGEKETGLTVHWVTPQRRRRHCAASCGALAGGHCRRHRPQGARAGDGAFSPDN